MANVTKKFYPTDSPRLKSAISLKFKRGHWDGDRTTLEAKKKKKKATKKQRHK